MSDAIKVSCGNYLPIRLVKMDWSRWANTLAHTLHGGAALSFVRTVETGQMDAVRENLSGKQQATIEYAVGALAGGVTRFVFGRDVIVAARAAFADFPDTFPEHLARVEAGTNAAKSNRTERWQPWKMPRK